MVVGTITSLASSVSADGKDELPKCSLQAPITAIRLANAYRPFDHVPNELLIIIFRHAIASLTQTATTSFERARLGSDLSSVSRRWRTLAHVIPELWSSAYLPQPDREGTSERVTALLTRSAPLPMHFDVSTTNPLETLHADIILRRDTPRIGSLTFRTSVPIPTCFTCAWTFANLEELKLVSLDWVRDMRMRMIAPKLRSLHCTGVFPSIPVGDLQSLEELTLCEYNVMRIAKLALVVSRWPAIQRLTLCRWTLEVEESGYQVPVRHMPELTYLKFEKMGLDAVRGTLAMINAPALETLLIEDVEDPLGGWLDELWASIEFQHMESLQHLRLHKFHKNDGPCTLASILRVAPNVTHLSISDVEPDVFETIIGCEDYEHMGRLLQVLEIDAAIWPFEHIVRFIQSRARTLKQVHVPQQLVAEFAAELEAIGEVDISALESPRSWKAELKYFS
ncbi:hypothetical protein FS837_000473 [Tulasnella sp. UAMH 9824]|nr:hypothetical protein FS837_000473 [Tulasnella sp. UAMH 9824]